MKTHAKQIAYIALTLISAVFVLVYRGPFWPFIRGHMGDWLVVQLMYLIARFWIGYRWRYLLAIAIFISTLVVELVKFLAAGSIPRTFFAEITIGSTFDPLDMIAFSLGLLTVVLTERYWKPSN